MLITLPSCFISPPLFRAKADCLQPPLRTRTCSRVLRSTRLMRMILLVLALAPGTAFMAHAPRRFAVQAPRVSPFAAAFSPDEAQDNQGRGVTGARVHTWMETLQGAPPPRVLPPMRPYAWLGAGVTLQLAAPRTGTPGANKTDYPHCDSVHALRKRPRFPPLV